MFMWMQTQIPFYTQNTKFTNGNTILHCYSSVHLSEAHMEHTLAVPYPLTTRAGNVDAFLFFQSECRFSHFRWCSCSFSCTIFVADGPLKQIKTVHGSSNIFDSDYPYIKLMGGKDALVLPLYAKVRPLNDTPDLQMVARQVLASQTYSHFTVIHDKCSNKWKWEMEMAKVLWWQKM